MKEEGGEEEAGVNVGWIEVLRQAFPSVNNLVHCSTSEVELKTPLFRDGEQSPKVEALGTRLIFSGTRVVFFDRAASETFRKKRKTEVDFDDGGRFSSDRVFKCRYLSLVRGRKQIRREQS